jgi:uncharacterized protein (DUF1778 family)
VNTRHPGGRPPLPPDERRAERLMLALTADERAELDAWAAARGKPLAVLIREAALRAAARARRET